jgi:hypothetical protein
MLGSKAEPGIFFDEGLKILMPPMLSSSNPSDSNHRSNPAISQPVF